MPVRAMIEHEDEREQQQARYDCENEMRHCLSSKYFFGEREWQSDMS